jgi:hypothetical protein
LIHSVILEQKLRKLEKNILYKEIAKGRVQKSTRHRTSKPQAQVPAVLKSGLRREPSAQQNQEALPLLGAEFSSTKPTWPQSGAHNPQEVFLGVSP